MHKRDASKLFRGDSKRTTQKHLSVNFKTKLFAMATEILASLAAAVARAREAAADFDAVTRRPTASRPRSWHPATRRKACTGTSG